MKIKSRFIKWAVLCFGALMVFGVAAVVDYNSVPEYRKHPHYLLVEDGNNPVETTDFIYYSINNNQDYAVALTATGKTKSSLTVESNYNGRSVKGIWHDGFAECVATSITLRAGLEVIDCDAFFGCLKLQSITIPYTVKQIGDGAFYSCKNLGSATFINKDDSGSSPACMCLGDEVTEPQTSKLASIPDFCFFNCSKLSSVTLPTSIETIGNEAFNGCHQLNADFVFQKLSSIGERAFQYCQNLKSISIQSTFFTSGSIGKAAFNQTNKSLKLHFYGANASTWVTSTQSNWNYSDDRNPTTTPLTINYITDGDIFYTTDWFCRVINAAGDIKLDKYIGPTGNSVKYISIPSSLNGGTNNVREIASDALDSVKTSIERLYLPSCFRKIPKQMFSGFTNLVVVDHSSACSLDKEAVSLTPRIILNEITSLEVIGDEAFISMPKYALIEQLYLPSSLKAIGQKAFGEYGSARHMKKVTDFKWFYDDTNSQLAVIGKEAFFKLGQDDNTTDLTSESCQNYINTDGTHHHQLSTVFLPSTFRHTGITEDETAEFNTAGETAYITACDGDYVFAGSPLIEEVVVRGSTQATLDDGGVTTDTNVTDLVLGKQTFSCNQSLRTLIIEERKGHSVVFYTNAGADLEPCIGWNAGHSKNDFRGDPALQTLILPNKNTDLFFQDFALQGNSRAALYFTGVENSNKLHGLVGQITEPAQEEGQEDEIISLEYQSLIGESDIKTNYSDYTVGTGSLRAWDLIGDEEAYEDSSENASYPGFNYVPETGDVTNKFGISQPLPRYWNVEFKKDYDISIGEAPNDSSIIDANVWVGKGNANDLILDYDNSKFAFICDSANSKAVVSKYLYDRYDSSFSGTAIVPNTINNYDSTSYDVKEIGDSAFSAAFCDDTSYVTDASTYKDLSKVIMPSAIQRMGHFAFLRAYGVKEITSYDNTPQTTKGDYIVPSSMTYVGQNAFSFTNIVKFRRFNDAVKFYENVESSASAYTTSVFSNNFSLRVVTYKNDDSKQCISYKNSYYTSQGGQVYTSAIYSRTNETTPYNNGGLMIVLNRDSADVNKVSKYDYPSTGSPGDTKINASTGNVQFSNVYPNKIFLYGAYKMGYWIEELQYGNVLKKIGNNYLSQPFISGVYDITNDKDSYIYLSVPAMDFKDNPCDLKNVTISVANNVLAIQPSAFEGCEQITNITLPRAVGASIPEGLFASVTNPNIVFTVPKDASGDPTQTKDCDPGVLDLTYTGYTSIGANAFQGTSFSKVIAPITSSFNIGKDAFNGCDALTEFDGSNVTGTITINDGAFNNATLLNKVDLSNATTVTINKNTFLNCDSLQTIDLSNVTTATFNESALENCTSLQEVDLSNATTVTINKTAFLNCTGLESIDFSNATTVTIKENAFENCTSLETIDVSGVTGGFTLEKNAFLNCTSLESFIAYKAAEGGNPAKGPTGAIQIKDNAFDGCSSLTTVDFSKAASSVTINQKAFLNCGELTNVLFPNATGAIILGNNSFEQCDKLETVSFPEAISTVAINEKAFLNCDKLTNVLFPKAGGAITLGNNAFENCKILETVDFGASTAKITIGSYAFHECDKLTDLDFSSSSEVEVKDHAFFEATLVGQAIDWPETSTVYFRSYAFSKCVFTDGTFVFPIGITTVTSKGYKDGEKCVFQDCDTLETVTAEGDLENFLYMGYHYFRRCTNLHDFDFSKFTKLRRIQNQAFCMAVATATSDGDANLSNIGTIGIKPNTTSLSPDGIIHIPASVVVIGRDVFFGCSGLVGVYIEDEIVPNFSESESYSKDDYVIKDHSLYKAKSDVSSGDWSGSKWTKINLTDTGDDTLKKGETDIWRESFAKCENLEFVYFNNPNTIWPYGGNASGDYFSYSTKLKDVWFPYNGPGFNNECTISYLKSIPDAKVYGYSKYGEVAMTNRKWRDRGSDDYAPLVYFTDSANDVTNYSNGVYSVKWNINAEGYPDPKEAPFFWTWKDGNPNNTARENVLYLGYVTAVDSVTGVVTYSTGYKMSRSGDLYREVNLTSSGTAMSGNPEYSSSDSIVSHQGDVLTFSNNGEPISSSAITCKDGCNVKKVDGNIVVKFGCDDKKPYLEDYRNGTYGLWYDYPSASLVTYVNNATTAMTSLTPHPGDVARYSATLNAGDKVKILFNEDYLEFPNESHVKEYVVPSTGKYVFYVNSSYDAYVSEVATVTFNVNYDTHNNGSLYAVGDFSGDYDPYPAYKLEWTDGNNWVGSFDIPVGAKLKLCVAPTENPTKGAVTAWESVERTVSGDTSVTGWNVE